MSNHSRPTSLSSSVSKALLLATCVALGGCSSEDDGSGPTSDAFISRNTNFNIATTGLMRVAERWLVFQADEFTHGNSGANFNSGTGDTDMTDSIAIVVDMLNQSQKNLRVAVDDIAILGNGTSARLYFVVNEVDDTFDWSGDGMADDFVLLTTPAQGAGNASLTYLATLGAGGPVKMLKSNKRLYFVEDPSAGTPLAMGETAINYVSTAAPTAPVRVLHADGALVDTMEAPQLVALDEGLLFFTLDETLESPAGGGGPGVNLNADADSMDIDSTDGFVLGLLDTTDVAALARNTAQAVASSATPVRALANQMGTNWTVAFLTNEDAQGAVNLNNAGSPDLPAGWLPSHCAGNIDSDTDDDVLAYISYADWVADPITDDPKNTGLVGTDRVVAVRTGGKHFVGTISSEADAECNLNGDAEAQPGSDDVFRWAPVGAGTPFFTGVNGMLAVKRVAGGTEGVTDFGGRFVIVADEAEAKAGDDFDGDLAADRDVVGWLNPNLASPAWDFDHSSTPGVQPATTDWMARRSASRLPLTFQEEAIGVSINGGGDADTVDSAPSFTLFDPVDDMDFPGPPVAVRAGNAGTSFAAGFAFYRVDEMADNRDWNGDGLADDFVLFRTSTATLQNSNLIGVLNDLARPAIVSDGTVGVAYITDEAMINVDINQDGDIGDLTPRYFRLP